jgi:hypothetical protein
LLAACPFQNAGERRSLPGGNGVVDCHERPAAKKPDDEAYDDR